MSAQLKADADMPMADVDTMRGLTAAEGGARLARRGPTALPDVSAPSLVGVFLRPQQIAYPGSPSTASEA